MARFGPISEPAAREVPVMASPGAIAIPGVAYTSVGPPSALLCGMGQGGEMSKGTERFLLIAVTLRLLERVVFYGMFLSANVL